VRISAKTDYAIRALLILADQSPNLVKLEVLIARQPMPPRFVESILSELRRAGLVHSQRGADGGYALALPAGEITLGAVMRVVDGPLAEMPRLRPRDTVRVGVAQHLPDVWEAVGKSLGAVLDGTTLEHVLTGALPEHVRQLVPAHE
jgi:Rrf2 family protein